MRNQNPSQLTEKSRDSSDLPHKKMVFHPFLRLDLEGATTEVLLQGLEFFSVQCGFTAFRLSACGVDGEKVDNRVRAGYVDGSKRSFLFFLIFLSSFLHCIFTIVSFLHSSHRMITDILRPKIY